VNTNIQTCEYEYTLDDPPPIKTKKVEKVVYRDVPSGDETIVEVPTYVDVDKVCVCVRAHTRASVFSGYICMHMYMCTCTVYAVDVYMYTRVYVYAYICIHTCPLRGHGQGVCVV